MPNTEKLKFEKIAVKLLCDHSSLVAPLRESVSPTSTYISNSVQATSPVPTSSMLSSPTLPEQEIIPQPDLAASSPDRRASLDRIRAVGQTFAEGIAAIRQRVSKPSDVNIDHITPEHTANNLSDSLQSAVTSPPDPEESNIHSLRVQNERLRQAANRFEPQYQSLKADYDRLKEAFDQKERFASNELTRVKVTQLESEKRLQEAHTQLEQVERDRARQSKRASALERVCIGLRSKLAIAEQRARDGDRLQEAVLARETAEIQLAELRAESEQLRVRCSASDVFKERADAAESSERALRDKVGAMARELQSREALLKQSLIEKKKLREYMARYERQLREKELKLGRMRRSSKRSHGRDASSVVDSEAETEGSLPTFTMEKDLVADDPLVRLRKTSCFAAHLGCYYFARALLRTNSNLTSSNSFYSLRKRIFLLQIDWEQGITQHSLESVRRSPAGEESMPFPESSPLMRELEQQQAILEAAFDEPKKPPDHDRSEMDLRERVRRLEAALSAIPQLTPGHNPNTAPDE